MEAEETVEKVIEERYPKNEKKKYKQSGKKYILSNKHSYPYELKLGRFYQRFEPAGKKGYEAVVDKSIIDHPDFQYYKKHVVVTEVK